MATPRSQLLGRLVTLCAFCALATATYVGGSSGSGDRDECQLKVDERLKGFKGPKLENPIRFYDLDRFGREQET